MDRSNWNLRYSQSEGLLWTAEPNRFLLEEAEDLAPGRALDLGSGEGRNAVWLAEQGWAVTGVDFSDVALTRARQLARARGVDVVWVLADLLEYVPPAESFDLVVVLYLHLPAAQRRIVLSRASSALAPGATLLVVGHDVTNLAAGYGGPPDPAILYSPDDLVVELPGLEIVRAERVRRTVTTEGGERQAIDALVRATRSNVDGA